MYNDPINKNGPAGVTAPRDPAHRKDATVDTTSIRTPSTDVPAEQERSELRLAELEERYRHELMGDEERSELRECVLRLRRKLSERGLSERG